MNHLKEGSVGSMKSSTRRTVVRLLIGLLLMVCGVCGVSGSPASASGEPYAHAQHNINYLHDGAIKYVGQYDRPVSISANEVCASQVFGTVAFLSAYGYDQNNIVVYPSGAGSCSNNEPFFNLVLTLAPTPLKAQGYLYKPAGGEDRGYACIVGQFVNTWTVCSTHLESRLGRNVAYLQSEQLRTAVMPSLGNGARIVGGDFNLRPRGYNGYNTYPWRGSWQEAEDLCFSRLKDRRTLQPGPGNCDPGGINYDVKIDYMWASAFQFQDAFGVADIRCGTASDHCLYFGTVRWR